jgi:glycosyltransferase involved in cell wall biosynthesis
MKILWIPHASWVGGGRVRSWSFIEKMRQKHEIHVLTWTSPSQNNILHFLNPKLHLDGLRNWDDESNSIYLHHYGRFHNVRFTPFLLSLNQKKFQSKIRNIVLNYKIDVIICGVNHYLNGFPPFDLKIPVVLDIIDFYPYKKVLETYLNKSAAVLCISHKLLEEALIHNKNSYYLPPAINLDKARSGCPDGVRQKYNLDGYKIVSLIGLTTSPSLYLLETIPLVKEVIPNVKYLIVGDNHFFASDVGTYPGDEDPFFTNAVATKVLEYAAARKPVVSSEQLELKLWNLPNVLISPPNVKDFAQNIINALTMDFKYSSLDEFQDKNLINNLEKILKSVL